MTNAIELFTTGLQIAGAAGILYGAVLALEIDVLVDRLLKLRALPVRAVTA